MIRLSAGLVLEAREFVKIRDMLGTAVEKERMASVKKGLHCEPFVEGNCD